MSSTSSEGPAAQPGPAGLPGPAAQRRRRRLNEKVKASLRDLRLQLALLNHQVSTRIELKDVDLDCLDIISRDGPLTPSTLSRRAGIHPATLTGILDRLERGGWVARERDPADRRAVNIQASPTQGAKLYRLYLGMSTAMDEVCDEYDEKELELIAGFLRRTVEAGRSANSDFSSPESPGRGQRPGAPRTRSA